MPFNKKNGVVDKTEWTDNEQNLWVTAGPANLDWQCLDVRMMHGERELGVGLTFPEAAELRDFLTDALQRAGHE